ncbi:ATPase SWSAP1 [Myxocyprinus asiaticus]|uniref:ATPase SWSAP1 n=1 Tax=Myxocyprinus asiaticus TaxID=70543 RepID=UPI002223786F|nr:ATPase SWSAP1 [Myxocyprinus asiaticus]
MADILGIVFRRFAAGSVTSDLIFPANLKGNTLVLGDVNMSTSVLFLAAVTAATDLGLKVLFFTQTPFQSLPVSLRGSVPGLKLESLKNIKFVYAKTLEELLEDVASLHELATETVAPPSLIIVDGLERYLHMPRSGPLQDELSPAAHVVALLHDTAAFLTQVLLKRGENQGENQGLCRIMVSFQSECEGRWDNEAQVSDLLLSVLDRYLQVRCTLEEVRGVEGAGLNEWQVYLSATYPQLDQHGEGCGDHRQQLHLVVQSGGVLEFRPVPGAEQEIPDQRDDSKQETEGCRDGVN